MTGPRLLTSVFLPFVLGTLVTACETQKVAAKGRTGTPRDSADQVLYGARSVLASNGVRRGELSGDTVLVFAAGTRFVVQGFRAQFATSLGRPLSVMTARTGAYRVPVGRVIAHGPVAIVSDTLGRRLDGSWVRYDPEKDQLESDSSFTATAGSRRLTGVGFTADPGLFTVKCRAKCVGSLGP
jgi:hypothetical protein